jgi:hypothetical protein
VADACRALGPTLDAALLPSAYKAEQLLWAICGNESSFGASCTPRHEPAYDVGGRYAQSPDQAALLARFGSAGACSYGPMQVMLVNAPSGFTPDLFADVTSGIEAGVFALGTLLRRNKPQSLTQIGMCYNHGSIPTVNLDSVMEYVRRLIVNYGVAMPA